MAKQRVVNTRFWDDDYVMELDPAAKLLFLYLITNPLTDLCGAYQITVRRMVFDTGLKPGKITAILEQFRLDAKMLFRDGWIVIANFGKHQQGNSPNVIKGAARSLSACPDWIKQTLSKGFQAASIENTLLPEPVGTTSKENLKGKPSETPQAATKKTSFPIPRSDTNPDLWNEWLDMRRAIKKSLTQHGYDQILRDLGKLVAFDINERLELAIDRKWQGLVFEEDKNGKPKSNSYGNKRTDADVLAESADFYANYDEQPIA